MVTPFVETSTAPIGSPASFAARMTRLMALSEGSFIGVALSEQRC